MPIRTHTRFHRRHELLESRHLLSSVGFVRHEVGSVTDPVADLLVADFDSDDDPDLLSVVKHSDDVTIGWHENLDGKANFATRRLIDSLGTPSPDPSIHLTDLDSDGDADVLVLILFEPNDGEVLWYENDGTGTFAPAQFVAGVTPEIGFRHALTSADFDNDGDTDVVTFVSDAASASIGEVSWYAHVDGTNDFGPATRIAAGPELGGLVEAVDIDEDGNTDVLASFLDAPTGGGLKWYKNDGEGNFTDVGRLIAYPVGAVVAPTSIDVLDVDGDNRDDVLTAGAFLDRDHLDYFQSIEGPAFVHNTTFGINGRTSNFIAGEDLDHDGDIDVIASGIDKAVWWEQTDSIDNLGKPIQIAASRVFATMDLNDDTYIDLIAADQQGIGWYENRLLGDANDDGVVDFADFVTVALNFGNTNVVWEDGDFDNDGTIGFADFLALSRNFTMKRNQNTSGPIQF